MELKDLGQFALLFLIIAIIIGVSSSVLTNLGDKWVTTSTKTVTNETITMTGNTSFLLIRSFIGDGIVKSLNTASGYYMTNGTNMSIGTNNYHFFSNGSINIKTGMSVANSEIFNFSYQYNVDSGTVAGNSTQYGNQSEEELASWIPTLAIIIVGALIIGIVSLYFKFG